MINQISPETEVYNEFIIHLKNKIDHSFKKEIKKNKTKDSWIANNEFLVQLYKALLAII